MSGTFRALLVEEQPSGFKKEIQNLNLTSLPKGELRVRVKFSSLNYKDALSGAGNKGVTKKYPHVPGIDASGVVVSSQSDKFKEGDEVLVTGFDLGMNTWGGFGEFIQIPADWTIPLPERLSMEEAMCFGTAGLTAGLSVLKIVEAGIKPQHGEIVVSGATGGVGSLSIAILSKLGYQVAAISGKQESVFLTEILGAKRIIDRQEFIEAFDKKPLAKDTFAAGIDTVGGEILSGMLRAAKYGSVITCCGMVASVDLNTSIFPFILRGVQLCGIDSVLIDLPLRQKVWDLLSNEWKPENLKDLVQYISLEDLPNKLDEILQGKARGRYVLRHR